MIYDVIVIGGGPGGYLAAERLSHAGKTVLLIEKEFIGGTCLNVGCIPTKTLLNSAKQYVHAKESAQFGVHAENVTFHMGEMMKWKESVITALRGGVSSMLKKLKVEIISGSGFISAIGKVQVKETGSVYETKAIIVATGSSPAMPPIAGSKNNPKVLDSTGLLNITEAPKKLCVIGGGVIGIEFAGLFSALGSEVSVVEMMDEIIPPMDSEQAPLLRKALKNVQFNLGCKVEKIEDGTVCFKTKEGSNASITSDVILMAVGRRPNTADWGAQTIGLDISAKGVTVDDKMRTNVSGVWAIGDVNGRSMLAHSAYRMAEVAVSDIIAQQSASVSSDHMRYNAIPWVVYGLCEAAGAGMTEQEAKAKNIAIKKASVPMLVSGRFIAENGTKAIGTVKVIADAKTDRLLGVHVLGSYASEMIWGAAALIEGEWRVSDIKQLVFPHPTVCETIRDAIWALD